MDAALRYRVHELSEIGRGFWAFPGRAFEAVAALEFSVQAESSFVLDQMKSRWSSVWICWVSEGFQGSPACFLFNISIQQRAHPSLQQGRNSDFS
jgi:hypothetical protein